MHLVPVRLQQLLEFQKACYRQSRSSHQGLPGMTGRETAREPTNAPLSKPQDRLKQGQLRQPGGCRPFCSCRQPIVCRQLLQARHIGAQVTVCQCLIRARPQLQDDSACCNQDGASTVRRNPTWLPRRRSRAKPNGSPRTARLCILPRKEKNLENSMFVTGYLPIRNGGKPSLRISIMLPAGSSASMHR